MNRSRRAEWWRPDVALNGDGQWDRFVAAEPKVPDSAIPFWALMAFTFIVLIGPQAYIPALAPLRIALLAAAVAIMTFLFDRFVHRRPLTLLTREMWAAACLVSWAILMIPLSYWPGGSLSFLLGFYVKTIAIFWLLGNVVNTVGRLRQVAWALSLMAVPLGAVGVGNFLSDTFMKVGPHQAVKRIVGYVSAASLTGNPNDLALMLNLILPLTAALLLATQRPIVRSLLLGMIFLDALAVIVTFSRTGFLTLATIFTTYLWKLRWRPERRWAWAALVVALACLPLLPSGYVDRVSTIKNIESDVTGSAQARWRDMMAAVHLVLQDPIVGAGVGMNALALNEARGAFWQPVHNVYLEYAVELGLPGLALFLSLLVGCVKSAVFVQRRSAQVQAFRELFYLGEGIQISLVAFAVAGMFHPVAYHFYFYYIAGLAIAARAISESEVALVAAPKDAEPTPPLSQTPSWAGSRPNAPGEPVW